MYNKRDFDLGLIMAFIFVPLYSVPSILKDAYNCNRTGIYLMSLIFATLAFTLIPSYDAVSHGVWAYGSTDWGDNIFWQRYEDVKDIFLPSLIYFVFKIGIDFHYVIFLCVFLASILFFPIYSDIAKGKSDNIKKILFISFLLIFPFLGVRTGLRNSLSMCIVIRGMYELFYKKNIVWGLLGVFVAPFVHFSTILFSVLCFVSYIIAPRIHQSNIGLSKSLWIYVTLSVMSVGVVQYIFPYLENYLEEDKFAKYTNAGDIDYLEGQNLNFMISYYARKYIGIICFFYILLKNYDKLNLELRSKIFFNLTFFLWGAVSAYMIMSNRFGKFAMLLFYVILFINCSITEEKIKGIKVLFYAQLTIYILNIWGMKLEIAKSSHLMYWLYMPWPLIMCMPYLKDLYMQLFFMR